MIRTKPFPDSSTEQGKYELSSLVQTRWDISKNLLSSHFCSDVGKLICSFWDPTIKDLCRIIWNNTDAFLSYLREEFNIHETKFPIDFFEQFDYTFVHINFEDFEKFGFHHDELLYETRFPKVLHFFPLVELFELCVYWFEHTIQSIVFDTPFFQIEVVSNDMEGGMTLRLVEPDRAKVPTLHIRFGGLQFLTIQI